VRIKLQAETFGAGAAPDPRPNLTAPRLPLHGDRAPLSRHSPHPNVLAANHKRRASGGPSGLTGLSLRADAEHSPCLEILRKSALAGGTG
jgi:hypothetical protein